MKVFVTLLTLLLLTDPAKIGKINTVKKEAKNAFQAGDYKLAAQKYRYLVDSLNVNEDEVMLNLANAYYQANDTANASTTYQGLMESLKPDVRSKALQQIGVMNNKKGKAEEALANFKQAIRADPSNEDARYNYEMLKKKLEEKKKQDEQKKKQDQKNKDDKKNQEPSEFAKKLKAQADMLVAQRQYKTAYDLMVDGLTKDQTVSTYQKYIDRIKDVYEINKK